MYGSMEHKPGGGGGDSSQYDTDMLGRFFTSLFETDGLNPNPELTRFFNLLLIPNLVGFRCDPHFLTLFSHNLFENCSIFFRLLPRPP